jgi:16S rRNA (cytosine967-C5)-methyltransferase
MNEDPVQFLGSRHDARSLALQVLLDCGRQERFIQDILDRQLSSPQARGLAEVDRRLATHMAYGVLRRRGTLYAILQPLITRDPEQVEPWLWDVLMLGAYQLALLTQIPPHAAIHATVELAGAFGRLHAKGFINGILRSCSALVTDDRIFHPGPDALPMDDGNYRRLTRPIFANPTRQPIEYLSQAFALPLWLAERWLERLGMDEAIRLGFWFARPTGLTLRINPLRISRREMLAALQREGRGASQGDHPQAIRLHEHIAVRELPGYNEGWFSVQDESAMKVASAAGVLPQMRVLDVRAAPGVMTTHLAELMRNKGHVVACDIDEARLQPIRELAQRLGLKEIETVLLDGANLESLPQGPFDVAVVDVPCSNTGVLGRRPEVRWRLLPEDVRQLVQLQEKLVRVTLTRIKPGGALIYSTCSIEPDENHRLMHKIVRSVPGLKLEAHEESIPGRPADGGFWARLRVGESGRG